jgi:single-stranded-DNA-specific exonuclease
MEPRLEIPPCPIEDVLALERELGVSWALAQVLVRRGLSEPAAARAWMAAAEAHDPTAFGGIADAVAVVLRHVESGSQITVHGDYDADGVCSAAILVRTLRTLGATADWFLPSRTEDGYGLSAATVERLAARGTRLLVTTDCGITAVSEVAAARALGMDVVVSDHHAPRADGTLPDAPLVHPAVCGYPCADLCAAGVAYKLARALLAAAGADPAVADGDLDLVALATVADCVPLRGENRRLVRAGVAALARTPKPGLRALMRIAQVDPAALDSRAIGFRLAPRINAAGRLHRADAGLELLLTDDPDRAARIAAELDQANAERRHTETRILFEAEAQVAELGDRRAYVLWGEDWHPGVIGIAASRIAERHHRPAVLVAIAGDTATGSGRSIPAFDLLGALDACAEHLLRHGGHRAAAGCTVATDRLEAFREAFEAHAGRVLDDADLVPTERVDAVVAGDELGQALAEELAALAPFGTGNPEVSLLVPGGRLTDPRPMGEGKHLRFTLEAGGVRARAVAFGATRLPARAEDAVDATFTIELNEWGGAVEPRLVLRRARDAVGGPIEVVGEPPDFVTGVIAEVYAPLSPDGADQPSSLPTVHDPLPEATVTGVLGRTVRDRRAGGVAGTIGALVASAEPVLVVCADVSRRLTGLTARLGGFALCAWTTLERMPDVVMAYPHVVALDPPPTGGLIGRLRAGIPAQTAHLAWGDAELRFAWHVYRELHDLRQPLTAVYRALRRGDGLEAALRGDGARPRSAAVAGRLLRVLCELGLVELDRASFSAHVPPAQRTELERSPAFRCYEARRREGDRWLLSAPAAAA